MTVKEFANEVLQESDMQNYIKSLSEKDFQYLLHKIFKTRYPELSEAYFHIDGDDNKTYIEVKY